MVDHIERALTGIAVLILAVAGVLVCALLVAVAYSHPFWLVPVAFVLALAYLIGWKVSG
jgi:hypothetical protein